ncbi:MAG: serine/threonine protein kinase [Planctomycetales bacterium]
MSSPPADKDRPLIGEPAETLRQDGVAAEQTRQLSLVGEHPPIHVPGFKVGHCLGRGAYGSVWLATERNTGKQVAIKVYSHRHGLDWSLLNREVEKLAVLYTSRNIVRLIDVGWDADPPYYVMEYLENGSLSNLLAQGGLPPREAVRLITGVLQALVHAHGSGILHCDIKPANILLDNDHQARLADFGQSRLSYEQHPALGTLFYMAPEQADLNSVPDARWDVYAIGAVLYQCLTGSVPYFTPAGERQILEAQTVEERLGRYRHLLYSSPKPVQHRRVSGVDKRLADIVDRCLELDPKRRYPNAQAVLDALDARERFLTRRPLLFIGILLPVVLLFVFGTLGHYAFNAAVRSAQETLIDRALESDAVAARILGYSLQREIEDRTAELLKVAEDDRVRKALLAEAGKTWEERKELRGVLDQWKQLVDKDRQAQRQVLDTSWFLCDQTGKQLYRNPPDQKTIDKNFAFRNYFHGKGYELPEDLGGQKPDPIREVYVSDPYRSRSAELPRIAISVPVWDEKHEKVIGVLGRSLALGMLLQGYKEQLHQFAEGRVERVIALVDSRSYTLLDHEWMSNAGLTRSVSEQVSKLKFDEKIQKKLQTLVAEFPEDGAKDVRQMQDQDREQDYQDPIGRLAPELYGGEWIAAFWPAGNTGWIAIVQERKAPALKPVEHVRERLLRYAAGGILLFAVLVGALWYFILRSFLEGRLGTTRRRSRSVVNASDSTSSTLS